MGLDRRIHGKDLAHDRQDGQRDASALSHLVAPGPAAIDHPAGGQGGRGGQLNPRHAPLLTEHLRDLVGDVCHPLLARFGTVAHEHGIGIKVTVLPPKGARDMGIGRIKGIVLLDSLRIPPVDVTAQLLLEVKGGLGRWAARFIHQKQITLPAKGDMRPVVRHRHLVFEAFQDPKCVLGNLDILFEAELDAGIGHGEGGGCPGIGGIAFNNGDVQAFIGPGEVIGGGAAHDPPTDDDHVVGALTAHFDCSQHRFRVKNQKKISMTELESHP